MREARQSAPRTRPAVLTALRSARRSGPIVTYSIIGVTVVMWLLQLLSGGAVTQALLYWPPYTESQPWRMLTAVFLHSQGSPLHILFNMYSLWIFGRMLEPMLGRARFAALYFLAGFGGSVAVLLIAPSSAVVGASGAIFGLLGAFFVIVRGLGGNPVSILVVLGLNLVMGFVIPGISWQAHLGGLIVGALTGLVFMKTRNRQLAKKQWLLLGAIAVGLIVLTAVGVLVMHALYF